MKVFPERKENEVGIWSAISSVHLVQINQRSISGLKSPSGCVLHMSLGDPDGGTWVETGEDTVLPCDRPGEDNVLPCDASGEANVATWEGPLVSSKER